MTRTIIKTIALSILLSLCYWLILLFAVMRDSLLEPFRYMGF